MPDTNPYDNALGRNLRPSYRELYASFTTLASLGIGHETNNAIDELLVEAAPAELHTRTVGNDVLYGARLLETHRAAYLRGDREQFERLLSGLESQRRRLFFTLEDDTEASRLSPWALTVFRSGGTYLRFQQALQEGDVPGKVVRQLVRGLNRTFTGTMTNDTEKLWLAIPAGNVHDRTGRVLEHDPIPILRGRSGGAFITTDDGGVNGRPRLVLRQRGGQADLASIELRPLLFEYLVRVADGSLPASFSRQCFEELKHFRLQAVAALSALDDEAPTEADMQLVWLDEQSGRLTSSPLAVEETH